MKTRVGVVSQEAIMLASLENGAGAEPAPLFISRPRYFFCGRTSFLFVVLALSISHSPFSQTFTFASCLSAYQLRSAELIAAWISTRTFNFCVMSRP